MFKLNGCFCFHLQPGDSAEATGRLKKLQKLVHIKNGHQTDGVKDSCTAKKRGESL